MAFEANLEVAPTLNYSSSDDCRQFFKETVKPKVFLYHRSYSAEWSSGSSSEEQAPVKSRCSRRRGRKERRRRLSKSADGLRISNLQNNSDDMEIFIIDEDRDSPPKLLNSSKPAKKHRRKRRSDKAAGITAVLQQGRLSREARYSTEVETFSFHQQTQKEKLPVEIIETELKDDDGAVSVSNDSGYSQ